MQKPEVVTAEEDPLWFKDAVIYQTHVRAFYDSDGDGIGDFAGLTAKLDYLQDLGITALWILPFYPSPLRDDGYDIADYGDVNPMYGTLKDFRTFLREAHARGLKVITELVLNHTSDQHAWFQRARQPNAKPAERDFYVWSDTDKQYEDARIIFKDFETSNWTKDPLAQKYFWHRFYSHQPDLNFDNPAVKQALFGIIDFWLKMGVDGLRLDAVPYLFEREGTNCENLPETHAVLKELRKHVDENFPNRMLLAEANQWPEDAIAYFGEGDECHAAFHFPVMPRLFMSIQMEDRFPIIDIMQQTPPIPANCQWVMFLRNHDELTLEMVTDEERDYMYRVYARDRQARINLGIRRRLAPLLSNNRRKIELMNGLLFSLPGSPVIYYGDEIGMGDNIYLGDRNGVRTPMQWTGDRNAGFSPGNPQRLYFPVVIDPEYHYTSVNVETQRSNPQSLLWWMKRLIAMRQRYQAFSRGTLEFLAPENSKVLAFTRCYDGQCVLVVANLSRFSQYVELDLSAYDGHRPRELFGQSHFPAIGKTPYLLTVGPHGFYWFALEQDPALAGGTAPPQAADLPRVTVAARWEQALEGRSRAQIENALRGALPSRRWFGGKARGVQNTSLIDAVPLELDGAPKAYLTLLRVEYVEGEPDTYALPIAFAPGDAGDGSPLDLLARVLVRETKETGVLYDAMSDTAFATALVGAVAAGAEFSGKLGTVAGVPYPVLQNILESAGGPLTATISRADQSNSSVVFGDKLIMKLFRRVEQGVNPDLEVGKFLTETLSSANVPPVAGALEYRLDDEGASTLGLLQGFVPNEGTAWGYTIDSLSRYFEHVLANPTVLSPDEQLPAGASPLKLSEGTATAVAKDLIGVYLQSAELLGRRTAELHLSLSSRPDKPEFAPEPFSQLYQRSLYQSMRKLTLQQITLLRRRLSSLPPAAHALAQELLGRDKQILAALNGIVGKKIDAVRMRIHGDYHLGQVLYTGKDFVIIDFEGEPARSLSERRLKRSPLQDVAGMLRSFHYGASTALAQQLRVASPTPERVAELRQAGRFWYLWVSSSFLKSYLATAGTAAFVPQSRNQLDLLLSVLMMEKAVYELGYELNNRPDWVEVPLAGLTDLLDARP